MVSFIYIILAILALSFLIFIHELGHYFMAKRVGMKVETFAIGFGRPIYSWVRNGVKWQIGWILFGGYVKIAGQDLEGENNPYEVPGGFFSKSPWDRIKVAFMGPFVNLVFALLVFSLLWVDGGRDKNFSEYTSKIGWLDPKSELYKLGIRPGDEITAYNGNVYDGAKDHLYMPMTASEVISVSGNKVDYASGTKTPFEHTVKIYPHPAAVEKGVQTAGILQSGSYIIYNKLPNGEENPLPEGSPLQNSGIEYGDRLVWVDGEMIFSVAQLNHLLNDGKALLTVERGSKTLLRRVPRIFVQELKLDPEFREELVDWQFEAQLNGIKIQKLYAIPYNLTNNGIVENALKFIDRESQELAFPSQPQSELEEPLMAGDKIVAVDGIPIEHSYQILENLQQRHVHIIVERDHKHLQKISWRYEDQEFDQQVEWKDLNKIASSIGTNHFVGKAGDLFLLKPVVPKTREEMNFSPEKQALVAAETQAQKKQIEGIEDPEKKAQALKFFENREKQLLIGLPGIQDRRVEYNPVPTELFGTVFGQIWQTFSALVTGSLNPKWVSGPIGIVQIVHDNWMLGMHEALYWIGAISLNLGILNLLPIPMLDGGTILISFMEMITGRKLHPKTLEKLILPFAIILIAFFVYLTFNDVSRIFGSFLR